MTQWKKDKKWFKANPERTLLVREVVDEDGTKHDHAELMIIKQITATDAFIKIPWYGFNFIDHIGDAGEVKFIVRNTEGMALLARKIQRMQSPINTLGTPFYMREVFEEYKTLIEEIPLGG